MAVLDRLRRTGTTADSKALTVGTSNPASESSTLARREPPVIHRLKSVFVALQRFIEANDDSGLGRLSFLMTTFMDELADELGEKDEVAMSVYMAQIGDVIGWIGHGDNSRLSPELRKFAEMIQPSDKPTADTVFVAERDSSGESTGEPIVGHANALSHSAQT